MPENFAEGSFTRQLTKICQKVGVKYWPQFPFKLGDLCVNPFMTEAIII